VGRSGEESRRGRLEHVTLSTPPPQLLCGAAAVCADRLPPLLTRWAALAAPQSPEALKLNEEIADLKAQIKLLDPVR